MNIRSKIFLTVVFILIILEIILYFSLSKIMMSGFESVENKNTKKNVERVIMALDSKLDSMESSLFTWTQWDDAYKFITDNNQQFIDSNISYTMYTGMKINFFLFVGLNKEVVLEGGYDLVRNKDIPVPDMLKKSMLQDSILSENKNVNKSIKGFMALPEGPLMITCAPITNTNAEASARGYILFARYLDGEEIKKFSGITHLDVDFSPSNVLIPDADVVPKDENIIQGITSIQDFYGKPILKLTVNIERSIFKEGKKSFIYVLISIICAGLFIGVIIIIVLERIVINRLIKLNQEVNFITNDLEFDKFVEVSGKDEISSLAKAINGMIASVSEFLDAFQGQDKKKK